MCRRRRRRHRCCRYTAAARHRRELPEREKGRVDVDRDVGAIFFNVVWEVVRRVYVTRGQGDTRVLSSLLLSTSFIKKKRIRFVSAN